MEKQEKIDRLLFGLFIGLALASAWASLNYFQTPNTKNKSIVAKTVSTSNLVKRKSKGDLFFNPIATDSDLYLRDHVTTAVGSNVEIEFSDGGRLFLREMSHVILDNQHKATNIEIEFGRIQVQLDKDRMVLIDGTKIIKSTSDKSILQYSKSGNKSEILLIDGELEVQQGPETKQIDRNNASGYWSEDGGFYELKKIDILEPIQNKNVEVAEKNIPVKWVGVEGADKYLISLYKEYEFLKKIESRDQSTELEIMESGNFELLIEGLRDNRVIAKSPMVAFKVSKSIELTPLSPIGKTLKSEDHEKISVEFEWEKIDSQGLLVSVEHQTSELWELFANSEAAPGEDKKILELKPGRYRWRISPLKEQNTMYKSSGWKEFSVVEKIWPLIKPPNLKKIERPWKAEDAKGLSLVWDKTDLDSSYEIEINSEVFKSDKSRYMFMAPKPIKTKYRVRVFNKNQKPGPWSGLQTLHLQQEKKLLKDEAPVATTTTTAPALPVVTQIPARIQKPLIPINNVPIPKINVPKDGATIQKDPKTGQVPVLLSRVIACDSYEIEIDDSPKFFSAATFKDDDENLAASVSLGKKYMRARCWSKGAFGTWTHPISFEVE